MSIKNGSQYDTRPCVSLHCVSELYCEDDVLLLVLSDTILCFRCVVFDQSDNPTDAKQGFHHIVNQLLVISIFDNVHTHLLSLSFQILWIKNTGSCV